MKNNVRVCQNKTLSEGGRNRTMTIKPKPF